MVTLLPASPRDHYSKAHECHPSAARVHSILAKPCLYWLHCKLSPDTKCESHEDPFGPDLQVWELILSVLQTLQQ